MALEVAAAIVGIIAAAGKVAETLGPVVSAFVHAPNHLQSILTEVTNTQTILSGLDTLFADLNQSPAHRRELIQLPQLVAALTDGVLLFSKLETLVDRLADPRSGLASRMQYTRRRPEIESLLHRLLVFKNSMVLMVNILQCQSDEEARRDRRELLSLTRLIMKNNIELSSRMKQLEDHFIPSNRSTIRSSSVLSSPMRSTEDLRRKASTRRTSAWRFAPQPGFQFDADLQASRPYRKAKRHTADFSFRSSAALSHAWTTMSEASLSDVSAISVVGLPLAAEEITNSHHYRAWRLDDDTQLPINEIDPMRRTVIPLPTPPPTPSQTPSYDKLVVRSAPSSPSNFDNKPVEKIQIVVKGAVGVELNSLIARFAGPPYEASNSANLVTTYDKILQVDNRSVPLTMETVSELPGADYLGFMDMHYSYGQAFVLVYHTTCRASFNRIEHYKRVICQYKEDNLFPIMIVGINNDQSFDREVSTAEARSLAHHSGCGFCEITGNDLSGLQEAFTELVRARWAFEKREGQDRIMEMIQQDHKRYLKVQSALTGRVSQLLKGGRRSKPQQMSLRADTALSAIDEG